MKMVLKKEDTMLKLPQ